MSDPIDLIDADELRREVVRPGGRWQDLDVVAETGSTNADLAAAARDGAASGTVRVAGFQSAGRGRQGRVWTAPPGTSIALSVLLRPAVDADRWSWLPLLTGLAVAEGLASTAGITARLKWPNDVLVEGRKICGILAERVETPDGTAVVVGMGVNVDLAEADLPVATATSLAVVQPDRAHPREPIVAAILAALDLWLGRWESEPASVATAYRERCDTLGRSVAVELSGRPRLTGTATAIAPDGRLVVDGPEGPATVGAGDVLHLR